MERFEVDVGRGWAVEGRGRVQMCYGGEGGGGGGSLNVEISYFRWAQAWKNIKVYWIIINIYIFLLKSYCWIRISVNFCYWNLKMNTVSLKVKIWKIYFTWVKCWIGLFFLCFVLIYFYIFIRRSKEHVETVHKPRTRRKKKLIKKWLRIR